MMGIGTYRALLIGNAEFPEDRHNLVSLKGPRNDPVRMREVLADDTGGLFQAQHVKVVAEADSATIRREIENILEEASFTDVVFLYYSGHGIRWADGDVYLCARDTIQDRPRSTALSGRWIAETISTSAVGSTVIILDCCHSGAFKGGGPADVFMDEFRREVTVRGRFVITSCPAAVLTKDADRAEDSSPFTAALVDALRSAAVDRDDDGRVTVGDVYEFLRKRFEGSDYPLPQRRFDGVGDVPLALRLRGMAAVAEVAASGSSQDLEVFPADLELRSEPASPPALVRVSRRSGRAADWCLHVGSPWMQAAVRGDVIEVRAVSARGGARGNLYINDPATRQVRVVNVRVSAEEAGTRSVESPLLSMAELEQTERIRAVSVFEQLADLASNLDEEEYARQIRETSEAFRSQTAMLWVMGSNKSGKSALVNALLHPSDIMCDKEWQEGPMVVNDSPSRAAVTSVAYADVPSVKRRRGERWEPMRLAQYLNWFESFDFYPGWEARTQRPVEFQIGWPAPPCGAGISFSEVSGRSIANPSFAEGRHESSAALIRVFRSDRVGAEELSSRPMGQDETELPTVLVINMINRAVDEQFAGFVWNKYVRQRNYEEKWEGQDLEEHDVFFVDAGKALRGRRLLQEVMVVESGLTSLELRLTELIHNHLLATRSRYQRKALACCAELDSRMGAGLSSEGHGGYASASLNALRAELLDDTAAHALNLNLLI